MGLPIWNYSDGDAQHVDRSAKDAHKDDSTAAARSVIRRRASVHGRRNNAAAASSRNHSSNSNSNDNNNRNTITGSLSNSSNFSIQHLPPPVPEPNTTSRSRHGAQTTIRLRDGTLTIGREGPRFVGHRLGAEGRNGDNIDEDEAHYIASHPEDRARLDEFVSTRVAQQQRAHRLGPSSRGSQASALRQAAAARSNELAHFFPDISASPPVEPSRPQSRTQRQPRTNLPTPPLDTSSLPDPSEILERFNNPTLPTPSEILDRFNNASLPNPSDIVPRSDLAALPTPSEILERNRISEPNDIPFTTRALSPDNGLGDRQRSPSPAGYAWQIIGNTITPDDSLPSTSTSFTTAAAATNASSLNHLDEHDISFDETMREMGIEVSSTPDSAHSSDNDISSDEEGDDSGSSSDSNPDDDMEDYAAAEEEINSQRSRIGMRLYDLAMSTPEGRQQVEALRRRQHHLPRHRNTTSYVSGPLSHEPAEISRDTPTLPTPLSHSGQDEGENTALPLPDPDSFSNDILSRTYEATSTAQHFFERVATDEDARNRIREARMRTRARIARYREARDRDREAQNARQHRAMAELAQSRGHGVGFVARRGGHSRPREPETIREEGRVNTT